MAWLVRWCVDGVVGEVVVEEDVVDEVRCRWRGW